MKKVKIQNLQKENELLEELRKKEEESHHKRETHLTKQNENNIEEQKVEANKTFLEQLQVISDLRKKLDLLTFQYLDPTLQVHFLNPDVLNEACQELKKDIKSSSKKVTELQKKLKLLRSTQKLIDRSQTSQVKDTKDGKSRFSFLRLFTKKRKIPKELVEMEVTRLTEKATQEEIYKKREYKIVSEIQQQALLKCRTIQELQNNQKKILDEEQKEKKEKPEECNEKSTKEKKKPSLRDIINKISRNFTLNLFQHLIKSKNRVKPQ